MAPPSFKCTRHATIVTIISLLRNNNQHVQVAAFSPVTSLTKPPHYSNSCDVLTKSFAVGKNDENNDRKSYSSSSSFQANNNDDNNDDIAKKINQELDPACSIEDEDCLAFSSLDESGHSLSVDHAYYKPLTYNAIDPNADPLCDFDDSDCHALLPTTYLQADTYLAASLRNRFESINNERINQNWKSARCPTTYVSVSKEDWVRRVDMEQYPIVACGGALGGVYVVNLEEQRVVGKAEGAHRIQVPEVVEGSNSSQERSARLAKQAMEKLYGKLDGGGVVAISIHGDLVASSGREGGVRLWRIGRSASDTATTRSGNPLSTLGKLVSSVTNKRKASHNSEGNIDGSESRAENALIPLGPILGLKNTIVTSLKFDSKGLLWTSCYDGTIRAYDVSDCQNSSTLFPPQKPKFQSDFTDSVLDMNLCEDIGCGVCATADGSAALFSLKDGQFFVGIMLFEVAARSALIMKHKDEEVMGSETMPMNSKSKEGKSNGPKYSVLCGGIDGTIHRIGLNTDPVTGKIDEENPFDVTEATETAIKPKHTGPVMCLASPNDGMFISGGQDGALRVWDCLDNGECKCLYALTGYKIWLGSACTDFNHLVSDGGENSIIVRDFSALEDNSGKASL